MAAKKSSGRFSKMVAVLFTSILAPIIVNVTVAVLKNDGGHATAPAVTPPAMLAAPNAHHESSIIVSAKRSAEAPPIIATSRRGSW